MKKLLLLLSFLLVPLSVPAQMSDNPVSWKTAVTDNGDGTVSVVISADIAEGWHIYDTENYEGGPNPTVFAVSVEGDATLAGGIESLTSPVKMLDPMFGMEIGYYTHRAEFLQKVEVTDCPSTLHVNVEWMCCNDTNCIPPADIDLDIPIVSQAAPSGSDGSGTAGVSIWSLILQALAWGLAAIVTPCVFPMIPMTVSFFIKGSEKKSTGRVRAMLYGLFIVLLYTVPIALIIFITWIVGGSAVTADIFNWLATHWVPNLIFFIVFMVFAASFFGAFEIVLPSKLVNGSDRNSEKKGIGGIFFMALTLVLVSFSCTGPIVGTVLIKSTAGEFWAPMLTMLAFSLAFALPFTVFALFPSWLKKLPKSGGWLNSVKVVLGFIEVALGFKFLSTADQTYQWGLLDREVYLAIWIVCFSMLGFYLLGKLRFKYDEPVEHISVLRLALAIASFSFVVYMIPGMWGAPLKAISGYLPPLQTQDFVLEKSPVSVTVTDIREADPVSVTKYADSGLELPLGLQGFFDLREAEAYAEKVGKPLFIDFTGLGCMNCREMESRVLSDPEILSILRNEYVVVALFGDDKRTKVAPEDWVTTDSGKVLKTLGKINSYYVLKEYGINAQPYYILKGRGQLLAEPRSYNLDVEGFRQFLKEGLDRYRSF